MSEWVVETSSPDDTEALGAKLARALVGGETILLVGDLGAGKTCFTRGIAAGLGIESRQVKSPSYNILHQYDGGRLTLQHFDAYFVREAEEFRRDGLDDFLADGHVVVVEWADRFVDEFPSDRVIATFEFPEGATDEDARRVTLSGAGAGERIVDELARG